MITVKLATQLHNGEQRIFADAPKDENITTVFKSIKGSTFSLSKKMWHFPYNRASYNNLLYVLKGKANIEIIKNETEIILPKTLHSDVISSLLKFKHSMKQRRYAASTIDTYYECLELFFNWIEKPIEEITNDDILKFNTEYIVKRNLSASYQSQFINALKLFYAKILSRKIDIEMLTRPKKPKALPNVLSKEEVKKILDSISNIKHKAMLSLIYSCGLRCGELIHLKPEHIDSKRKVLIIKQAKGRKDRIAPLSEKIIEMLRTYYLLHKPKVFLFEGQNEGEEYTSRSLQLVLKQALVRTGIVKPVTLHWLRHSYATHLLENGTDLRYIQEILGHSSSKTTEIYTHVSTHNIQKIISPFDYL